MKTTTIPQVQFKKWHCNVHITKYQDNDRKAICLMDSKTEEDILIASINVPHIDMEDNEVAIKNYSENSGILDVLIQAGIISKPNWYIGGRFTKVPVCKILI